MTKNKAGEEFSYEREWRVILEDLRSRFRVFGEGLGDVRGRIARVEDKVDTVGVKVDRLEIEMSFVRKVIPTVATKDDLRQLERRLVALETTR